MQYESKLAIYEMQETDTQNLMAKGCKSLCTTFCSGKCGMCSTNCGAACHVGGVCNNFSG